MHFEGTSLSNSLNIVREEEFWKVVIIIEIYCYIFSILLVQPICEKIFVLLLYCAGGGKE